jgi:predicted nucleic acid-binding protein
MNPLRNMNKALCVLLDTNIALDDMLDRKPFCVDAKRILFMAKQGYFRCFVSASAITDIFYMSSREWRRHSSGGKATAMAQLKALLSIVSVAGVDEEAIRRAVSLGWDDFEDAVQYAAGEAVPVDYLVTRDPAGFADAPVQALNPAELLDLLTGDDDSND